MLDWEKPHPEGSVESAVAPPFNAGFGVVRPSRDTLNEILAMFRRGNFSAALTDDGYYSGWDQSGIGYFYGGISIQGLLPAFYFRDAIRSRGANTTRYSAVRDYLTRTDSRFRELDQCVYNVLGHKNCWGNEANVSGTPNCRNVDCSPQTHPTIEGVKAGLKVIHFTGTCRDVRPWEVCTRSSKINLESVPELCQEFLRRWVIVATSLLERADHGHYIERAPMLPECVENLRMALGEESATTNHP